MTYKLIALPRKEDNICTGMNGFTERYGQSNKHTEVCDEQRLS